jgi:hypothetical protein
MADEITRRSALARFWKWGVGLMAVAGAWTTWDLLQPLDTGGFGGKVRAVPPDAVPDAGVVEVPAALAEQVREQILTIMSSTPDWLSGCPIEAEATINNHYTK